MTTPTPSRDIAALDVPLAQLEPAAVLSEAAARTHSPSDRIAYALDGWLVTHPDALVSTDLDYPNWTPGRAS
jgi:hypothetical protein